MSPPPSDPLIPSIKYALCSTNACEERIQLFSSVQRHLSSCQEVIGSDRTRLKQRFDDDKRLQVDDLDADLMELNERMQAAVQELEVAKETAKKILESLEHPGGTDEDS